MKHNDNVQRAVRSVTALAAAACLLGMTGCASIASGSQWIGNKVGVQDQTFASAVGGCLVGGAAGALGGGLAKGPIGAAVGFVGGCALGGSVAGAASIKVQLDEARKQQEQINATFASLHAPQHAEVYTKMVADPDHPKENHQIPAFQKMVVPMMDGHGAEVQTVLKKVAALTAASSKVPRIDVYAKAADRQTYIEVLNAGLQSSKVEFTVHTVKKNPHLDVTPIPDTGKAPAAPTAASAPAASGAIYQPSAK
ncbi:hypothetical protein [Burkholderia glumae]|uniref:hypothetical protein n=1 Tax=Burkholderia glumae TaxID=337 RepID=UPI0021500CCA|nr:hypothetical protein [Burkholderia glumae]